MPGDDQGTIGRFADDCATTLGDDLVAVVLHRDDDERGRLATVVFVRDVAAKTLQRLAPVVRRWARSGVATPLVLDAEYLATSCDVFPLEILELVECHELVRGDRDPLAGLSLDDGHLRLEVEQQLKGKLLHLRQAYLECAGDRRAVRTLLVDSSPGFGMILRGLLKIADRPRGASSVELAAEVERLVGAGLATFRQVLQARRGEGALDSSASESTFASYLAELTALARYADRITRP